MVNAGLQLSFKMSKQIAPFALETFGCQTFVSKRICKGNIRSLTRQMYGAAIHHDSAGECRVRTFGGANG